MKNLLKKDFIKKIIVFKFGGIGDYVNMLPFLEDLRNYYPDIEITAITSPQGKELLENGGHVDKCIVSDIFYLQGAESVFSLRALRDILDIRKKLEPPYDIYIDLVSKYSRAGTMKPLIIKLLSHPRFSIGLSYRNRGFFLDSKIPEYRDQPKHNIERYNDILRELGASPEFHLPQIIPSEKAREKANAFFNEFEGKTKIGLHPGANAKYFYHRAWPVERFAELTELIEKENDCVFFASGAAQEEKLVKKLQNISPVIINLLPREAKVVDFCAYLAKLDCFISNDTGPMHLAIAMGIPTVGIFGRADFNSYGTYPENFPFKAVVLEGGGFHSPSPSEEDPRGLLEIQALDVFEKFKELKNALK
jgi:ADP-heptose:LPS heptosyltransferase